MKIDVTLTADEVKTAIAEYLARRNTIPADTDPEDVEVTADEEDFAAMEVSIDNGDDDDGELPDFEDDDDEDDDADE